MRWLITADRAEAKIFKQVARGLPIQMITRIEYPEGRMRNQELKEGRPGRAFESGPQSHQRHTMDTEESPREHAAHEFARIIVSMLNYGRLHHQYDEFVLASEPGFLGRILSHMDDQLERVMARTIRKNVVHLSDQQLSELFKDEPQE